MGNCLPFSNYTEPEVKPRSSEDNSNIPQVESSVKDTNCDSMEFNSKHLQSSLSKDEIFFDSNDQAWLDSDVEDFQSVNSDSTTMDIGSTPQLHDNNSITSSHSDGLMAIETSSSEMKKQLIDLFRDSFANDVDENKHTQQQPPTTMTTNNATAFNLPPNCKETTPNGQSKRMKPKSPQVSCCLPNLVRSLSSSSSEKKKK